MSAQLNDLVLAALEQDPARRPEDAGAFLATLRSCLRWLLMGLTKPRTTTGSPR